MVDTVGGPTNLRPDDPSNPYPHLTNFSLLSHGFGIPNISAVLSVIQNYFNELLAVYDGGKYMMNFLYTDVKVKISEIFFQLFLMESCKDTCSNN